MADHEMTGTLLGCIDRAVSAPRQRGTGPGAIRHVLLLGEGCALPLIRDTIGARFPDAALYADHPLDAVARGAASQGTPARAQDRISRSYALRYWDSALQEHHFRYLVHSGSRYPSAGQVARIIISAAYDGQTHLGIPLYEIGGEKSGPEIELVSESGGGVRLAGPAQDADAGKQAVHANERSPTLLVANPPGRKGEPRFECTFSIDPERNLCLSARDLVTGKLVKLNDPVHRMA